MANIEKRHMINTQNLSGEFYFDSLLQEAYTCGLIDDSDVENIQLQCISLLSNKCGEYNRGESSSIRVETAESIMRSNLYSIGLYLKSLPDPDYAVEELNKVKISELYKRGRELVIARFQVAKRIYDTVQNNRLDTLNQSYNSTLSENGIGIFFKSYNLEYEAHDCPASIDYQLCNPVHDLAGIEFIQKYLENLYLENEFCMNFTAEKIDHLLYGYDKGYAELLVNIFELVLTAAIGVSFAHGKIRELNVSREEIQNLNKNLQKYDSHTLMLKIHKAIKNIYEELNIANLSLQKYIENGLPKIATNIGVALNLNTLSKVFITSINPDLEPKIHFESGAKMPDEEYRRLIDELLRCRYSSDKLELIKEKVKSLDDLEDLLLDAQFNEEEFGSVLNTLKDVEIAAMIRRHPFESDVRAGDLSEAEQLVRLYLENYIKQLSPDRQNRILHISNHLIVD